ncbi:FG-GAP repeat domain-containing protein [Terrabacter sp. Ter38]|uniref:FG-GAP repeat domain-containing protein n=1 Tax=Terrabacter sp. Ter38 TaxID=2926030 RepID=UPI0035B2F36C
MERHAGGHSRRGPQRRWIPRPFGRPNLDRSPISLPRTGNVVRRKAVARLRLEQHERAGWSRRLQRDGDPDLLARQDATGELWLYPGRSGGFAAKSRIGRGWNGMRDLTGIGDYDRDGHPDLFAVQTTSGKLLMYPGRGTSLGASLQVGTAWTGYRPLL